MSEPLITVADVMTPGTETVGVRDTVATATERIRRYTLLSLPVVDGDRVVGLVTPFSLLREPAYRFVADVMLSDIPPVTPSLTLLQAHALMTRHGVDVLPVVDAGRVVGQLSLVAILRALGQQTDPLTGLPWATALRAWAGTGLAHGHEIAVLFIDMDNFGIVNKTLGHVVGDDILRSIATLLGTLVDVSTDLLCRYAGDEFAIATTRPESDARALARRIQETVSLPVEIADATRYVTVSVGFAGGRRIEGRTASHIAATVDDLLTLASRASTAAKEAAERSSRHAGWDTAGASGAGAAEARLRFVEVTVHGEAEGSTAAVTLRFGDQETVGRATGPVHGRAILYLVAEATLAAIREAAGDHPAYILEEITEVSSDAGRLVVAVLTDRTTPPHRFVGGASAPDLPNAAAKAILDALNRLLARILAERLRRDPCP